MAELLHMARTRGASPYTCVVMLLTRRSFSDLVLVRVPRGIEARAGWRGYG